MRLDLASLSAALKLLVFMIVTGIATAILMIVIGNAQFGDTRRYRAVFDDVTGLAVGDDVRVAGVRVGRVKEIDVDRADRAVVAFDVESSLPLTTSTQVTLRFRNLVGQRYMALSEGDEGSGAELPADGVIGRANTRPALDLTTLFNGFKPLFASLSPKDTNQLAYEIVQVFQGEGTSVESLLSRTSALTQTLADRDDLISDVITNLTTVLKTFNDRGDELSSTISTLQQFISGLSADRGAITDSLGSIADLSASTADLLSDIRPDLTGDIAALDKVTANLSTPSSLRSLNNTLDQLPVSLDKLAASSQYGPFFDFYICDLAVKGRVPAVSGAPGLEREQPFRTEQTLRVTGDGARRCSQ